MTVDSISDKRLGVNWIWEWFVLLLQYVQSLLLLRDSQTTGMCVHEKISCCMESDLWMAAASDFLVCCSLLFLPQQKNWLLEVLTKPRKTDMWLLHFPGKLHLKKELYFKVVVEVAVLFAVSTSPSKVLWTDVGSEFYNKQNVNQSQSCQNLIKYLVVTMATMNRGSFKLG